MTVNNSSSFGRNYFIKSQVIVLIGNKADSNRVKRKSANESREWSDNENMDLSPYIYLYTRFTAKKSNINKIQAFQNIALGKLTNAPPYVVSNDTLHKELKLKSINEEAESFYKRFHNGLGSHKNFLFQNLVSVAIP